MQSTASILKLIIAILILTLFVRCDSSIDQMNDEVKDISTYEQVRIQSKKNDKFSNFILKSGSTSNKRLEEDQFPKILHPEAIGIWMVPNEKASFYAKNSDGTSWAAFPWPSVFKYDGAYITLQLFIVEDYTSINPITWLSKDSHYKLKTTWQNDSLFYLSPFHTSTFMAYFTDSSFLKTEVYEDTIYHTWEFLPLTKDVKQESLKPLLRKRSVFNYN